MPLTIAEKYPNVWVVHNGWGDGTHAAASLEDAVAHITRYLNNHHRLGLALRWA